MKPTSLYISLWLVFVTTTLSLGQTFSVSPGAAIPDFDCLDQSLTVSGLNQTMNATFGLEEVCVDISHTRVGHLSLTLITPLGKRVLLVDQRGGVGDNFTNTCFDGDPISTPIADGTAPFTGSFLPEEPLGRINDSSEGADGNWVLEVCDNIFGTSGTLNSFSLTFGNNPAQVPASPNDECSSAIAVTVNANYLCQMTTSGTIIGATASSPSENCNFPGGATFDDDVWFSFVPSTADQEIVVTNIAGTTTDLIYQVMSGSCGALTQVACHNDPDAGFEVNNLTAGNTYYLRIATLTTATDQDVTFDLCIKEAIPDPPPNDDCNGATLINLSGTSCSFISGTLAGATASGVADNCPEDGGFNDDVWFRFNATESSHEVVLENIAGSSNVLDYQVLKGPCGNLTEVLCHFDDVPGSSSSFILNNLENATYYIRIASFLVSPQNTTFDICVKSSGAPPSNDECAGAIQITPSAGVCTTSQEATLLGATMSGDPQSCPFTGVAPFDDDVWFFFNATETSHQIDITNITGSSDDLIYEIFSGSCVSLTSIRCHDDPDAEIILKDLIVSNPYFIRVASFPTTGQTTTFSICVKSAPTPPANDECTGATSLTIVDTSCNGTSATLAGATPSSQAENCQIQSFFNDIWFSFTANQPTHVIEFSNIVDRPADLFGQISSGTCGGINEVDCFSIPFAQNNTSYTATGLQPGTAYLLRIASYDVDPLSTTFDICVRSLVPPCTLVVTNTNNAGPGSLRNAIECSEPGDTIRFDAAVNGQTITIDTPKIVVAHDLVLEADFSDHITLSNSDISHTNVLICIQGNLIINGLRMAGLSPETMILKIEEGGSLELFDSEIEQATVDR